MNLNAGNEIFPRLYSKSGSSLLYDLGPLKFLNNNYMLGLDFISVRNGDSKAIVNVMI